MLRKHTLQPVPTTIPVFARFLAAKPSSPMSVVLTARMHSMHHAWGPSWTICLPGWPMGDGTVACLPDQPQKIPAQYQRLLCRR